MNHGQGPLWLESGGQQPRETEGWKIVFTIWGPREGEGEAERRKGERPNWWSEPEGPESIWKATLCLALYCTPCCFNQWQACSQSLEQEWLFLIVSLLLPLFLLHYTPTLPTNSLKSFRACLEAGKVDVLRQIRLLCEQGKSSYTVMMI